MNRIMKKFGAVLCAGALVFSLGAVSASAAETEQNTILRGQITEINGTEITLRLSSGGHMGGGRHQSAPDSIGIPTDNTEIPALPEGVEAPNMAEKASRTELPSEELNKGGVNGRGGAGKAGQLPAGLETADTEQSEMPAADSTAPADRGGRGRPEEIPSSEKEMTAPPEYPVAEGQQPDTAPHTDESAQTITIDLAEAVILSGFGEVGEELSVEDLSIDDMLIVEMDTNNEIITVRLDQKPDKEAEQTAA